MGPELSIVVVNYERADMTARCLAHVARAVAEAGIAAETILVDNGSRDASTETLRPAFPGVSVIAIPANGALPAALNRGWRSAGGRWVLMLNNDVLVDRGSIAAAIAVAGGRADVGTVAIELRFGSRPGVINSAGIAVDRLGVPFDLGIGTPVGEQRAGPVEVFGACGGAALYRREMLEALGGFDESFRFGFEDVDLSWRAQMHGWKTLLAPAAIALHAHGGTVAAGSAFRAYQAGLNRVRLLAKHVPTGHLLRYGAAMIIYDAAYVLYAAARQRTLAPLSGRLRGLREWRTYRRRGRADRRPVDLAPVEGLRAALRRRAAWSTLPARSPDGRGEPPG